VKSLDPGHILSKIVDAKRLRLHNTIQRVPLPIARRMAEVAAPAPSFSESLHNEKPVRIIAEVKKASPSKGVFREDFSVDYLVRAYSEAGATAISVVTEEDFFLGSLAWVSEIRKASPLPVLRKDFVFDHFQIYETRGAGASAILLIAAMLKPDELKSLLSLAKEVQLDALVEIHDERELDEALEADATIIGVNNRNLKTFEVKLETSFRLSQRIPDDRLFVVESGIRGRSEINELLDAGADAFLIGESLITSSDPGASLHKLQELM
jgi:indole-3-glycerol phosphate synthase